MPQGDRSAPWTEDELDIMAKALIGGQSNAAIGALLPHRARFAIRIKTQELCADMGIVRQQRCEFISRDWDAPTGVTTHDDKHLDLILAASPRGFPFCVLPPSFRVAA